MKKLVDGFFVAPQVSEADIQSAAKAGIRVIINNRNEGEAPAQPDSATVKEWAEAAGMLYFAVPVSMQQLNQETLRSYRDAAAQDEGPVLAYCASGMRSASVWALVQSAQGKMAVADILQAVAAAGYDPAPLAGALQQLHGQGL